MMTGLTAILGAGGGGGIGGTNTLRTGGSDYANVTDSATLQFSSAMTIAAYVNIDTTGGKQTIISKDAGASDGYELYYDTTAGKFKGHIYISGAIKEVESAITPLAGVWYNVALWHDGTNLKLYVDGVQSGIVPASGSIDTNTAVFRIGASSTTVATNVFNGSIALVMGWNDDLTPAELTEIVTPNDPSLYTQQASMKIGLPLNGGSENPETDTKGNNNNAVLINGADYTGVKLAIEQSSGGGPAEAQYNMFAFDAVDDEIVVSNGVCGNNDAVTISAWVKISSSTPAEGLIYAENDGTSRAGVIFRLSATNRKKLLIGGRQSSNGTFYNSETSTDVLTDDTLHFVTGVINTTANNHKIYVDGALVLNESSIGWTSDIVGNGLSFNAKIGEYFSNNLRFLGDMSSVSIYNDELNQAEVTQLYNGGKIPYYETLPSSLTSGCVMAIEMSSRDNTLNDLSGNSNNGTANGGVTDNGSLQTFAAYT